MRDFLGKLADAMCSDSNVSLLLEEYYKAKESDFIDLVTEKVSNTIQETNFKTIYVQPSNGVCKNLNLDYQYDLNGEEKGPDLIMDNNIIKFRRCEPLPNGSFSSDWMNAMFSLAPCPTSIVNDIKRIINFKITLDVHSTWNSWIIIIGVDEDRQNSYSLDNFFPKLFLHVSEGYLDLPVIHQFSEKRTIIRENNPDLLLKLYAFHF